MIRMGGVQIAFRNVVMKLLVVIAVVVLSLAGCNTSPEVRKERALGRAKAYRTAKDYPRAVLELKNAVAADPKDAEVRYQLGLAYIDNDDLRSAIQAFQQTVALDPKHSAAQVKLAEYFSAARDRESLNDATTRMEGLLAESPGNVDALSTLAEIELRLGRYERAEEHLAQVVARAPANVKAALGLAQLHLAKRQYTEAETALKRATNQQPPFATPHIILGEFYVNLNRPDDARAQFMRALEIEKDNELALLDLGTLQRKTGALTEAETTFKRLSSLSNPKYKTVHALFLMQTGQRDRGIEELRTLHQADPTNRNLRQDLLTAYRLAGRASDIDALLTAALKKNAKDTDALLHRSKIDLANGKYNEAQNAANEVLRYDPNSAQAHFLLAAVYGSLGNSLTRRQELAEAVRLDRNFLQARLALARILTASKAGSSALKLLDDAPDGDTNPEIIAERNRALFVSGEPRRTKDGIKQGLAIARTPELLVQDAVLKMTEQDFASSRATIEEILKNYPEETRALDVLVRISPTDALRRTREHVQAHPKSASLQFYLGRHLAQSGAISEARTAFQTARQTDPAFWQASLALANLSMRENKVEDARSLVTPLVAHKDASVPARKLLAAIEIKSGQLPAAVEQFRKIAEARPNDILAMNNLAYALAEYANLPDEALKIAQRAKEAAPDSAAVDDTLGWVLVKKGLFNNAVQYLESSVRRQPTAERHAHLAVAYARKGQVDRGYEHLNAAVKLNPTSPEVAAAKRLISTGN
jgi:tetratricopeptide (TPR) repeat protein